MEKIVSLAKRRGFIFQSSEIYGGLNSCWDYGPLGVELKNNVKRAWWRRMVQERDDMVGQDASILMHPRVWEASGHLEGFTDPLVDCKQCRQRFRADHVTGKTCPECGGELTEPRNFNLMFKTFMGPVEDQAAVVYLRPETAQGIFVNFNNILTTTRKRLPFGVAQIGKSFRNEITPGNFTFRTREFEQMEIEYFVKPGTDEEHFHKWVETRYKWYKELGISPERLRLRPHAQDELAHYAKACVDIEYYFPMGWSELEGIANRTDYDLKRHAEYSGNKLEYFDQELNEHYVPYVIEPSAGADRATLAFLLDAYHEEPDKDEIRVVLRFHPELAPVKVAVLPLSRKEPLTDMAKEISQELRRHWNTEYDDAKSIGRRYRRQDEIGTPFCVTVDFQSPEDQTVTVRDRDTMEQTRLSVAELVPYLREKLDNR
ncbi:MAG TPA: glycine--tRNA ligase [Firmicutes bacterium]|uniref:Glycine--tRNA ligase n=2 Tax=Capillibacterium thermochitinicola TaxID=2699427 RepID=A0A8J6I0Q2_9FIRM|nr:glycine--tRNA ligase [Capillibacterium thermochitinicola]HHW12258.1 glycine--tRNA ligase [Bacillota bacterium]